MPYGTRGSTGATNGPMCEGDKEFAEFVYNDVTGVLTNGMPLYVDATDSAEFNGQLTATATGLVRTSGRVVLGTNANAGAALTCVGVYQPSSPSSAPTQGDVVRVLVYGRGVVSVQSPAAGTAGTVGGAVIASSAVKQAVPGARSTGLNIGVITATATALTVGTTVPGIAAASATATLVNAFVTL